MILWWMRHDQRLSFNECWDYAQAQARTSGQPLYVLFAWNDLHRRSGLGGIPRMSDLRVDWTRKGLKHIQAALESQGAVVVETEGSASEWISKHQPNLVVYSLAVAADERLEEARVRAAGPSVQTFWTHTLFDAQAVPGGLPRLPPTFTPFRRQAESPHVDLRGGLRTEASQSTTSDDWAFPFEPGEASALARVRDYLAHEHGAAQYKTRRNGMVGTEFSTKFSPWLASGALSPRHIWHACLDLEQKLGGSPDVEWIRVELLWREYFQWVAYTHGSKIFQKKGFRDLEPQSGFNARAFQRWIDGCTGDDLVDAAMRELALTGFSSNRARQNMASYLIHDMGIDWRYGATYFESQLLDYDPASNWGNWAYLAGVGNDPRPVRRFNTAKQAQDYDSDGRFRARWLVP